MQVLEKINNSKLPTKEVSASLLERVRCSKSCLLIITAIKSAPDKWKSTGYELKNDTFGLEIWIANGLAGMTIKGHKITPHTFSSHEKQAIWQAYEWWVEYQRSYTECSLEDAIGGIDVSLFS